jgi:uncharacterized protein (TIGR03905 family)
MTYRYKTKGVCSSDMKLTIGPDGILEALQVKGGCNGNTKGLEALVKNRDAREVMELLKGIRCGKRKTSCPDQLACAIEEALHSSI